jgi:hypothetical protein
MNALFPPVPEREEIVRFYRNITEDSVKELRFNGDREAFVNANFYDFIALLHSGSVIWLNRNILVWSPRLSCGVNEFYTRVRHKLLPTFKRHKLILKKITLNFGIERSLEKWIQQLLICFWKVFVVYRLRSLEFLKLLAMP